MNEFDKQKQGAQTQNTQTGNFVAITIIIGILLAGGVYAFFKVQDYAYMGPSKIKIMHGKKVEDPILNAPESNSTNPDDIEKDLNMTDLDTLEQDLGALDQI